jgi:hypothetical protein
VSACSFRTGQVAPPPSLQSDVMPPRVNVGVAAAHRRLGIWPWGFRGARRGVGYRGYPQADPRHRSGHARRQRIEPAAQGLYSSTRRGRPAEPQRAVCFAGLSLRRHLSAPGRTDTNRAADAGERRGILGYPPRAREPCGLNHWALRRARLGTDPLYLRLHAATQARRLISLIQSLVDTGNVLLVATDAVQRLGVDEIKLALRGIAIKDWMPGTRLAPEMARSA